MKKLSALSVLIPVLVFTSITVAGQDKARRQFKLTLPGRNWALELALDGFQISDHELRPDGEGRKIVAENRGTGVVISVFIERAPRKGNTKECREYWWNQTRKSSPLRIKDVKMSESNHLALVEYLVEEHDGRRADQKNYHAYLAKDDVWVDVHLSKINFKPGEEALFFSVLDTVKIDDNYSLTSLDYSQFGSGFYLQGDYKKAIQYYEQALVLEKKERKLPLSLWRVILDNLGMSYGMSGALTKAKEVFEYGISKDPEYPIFYYNLACTYAEMNDVDNAIANLQTAFKHRNNVISGERMPNPERDSSFRRIFKDHRFQQLLQDINR